MAPTSALGTQAGALAVAGLAPELVRFDRDMVVGATHNLLRPETVEALFVLWRTTGDVKYRTQGWAIFQAFEKHCKVRTHAEILLWA